MHGNVQLQEKNVNLTLCAEQGMAASQRVGLPSFGENAIIDRKPRAETAVALTDCKLLILPLVCFDAATAILPNLRARLRDSAATARANAIVEHV